MWQAGRQHCMEMSSFWWKVCSAAWAAMEMVKRLQQNADSCCVQVACISHTAQAGGLFIQEWFVNHHTVLVNGGACGEDFGA